MKSVLPVTILLGLTAVPAAAGSLTIPMSFEYLALDGQQIATNSFKHKAKLELNAGTHKIAIRYHDLVDDAFSDSQSFVKSAPFILTLKVTGDEEYLLDAADEHVSSHPRQFAKAPKIRISRADNADVNYQVMQTDYQEDTFVERLFGGNSGTNIPQKTTAATGSVIPGVGLLPSAPIKADTAQTGSTKSHAHEGADPQQMLQYWWLQADEQTRKEFMSWAIKQL